MNLRNAFLLSAALLLFCPGPSPAALVHRYSFNEAAGSRTATDSVGGANGTLMGGSSITGDGLLDLDGANGYVDLPNGIVSRLTNATFEAWFTWRGNSGYPRLFDFGGSTTTEGDAGSVGPTGYVLLCVHPDTLFLQTGVSGQRVQDLAYAE